MGWSDKTRHFVVVILSCRVDLWLILSDIVWSFLELNSNWLFAKIINGLIKAQELREFFEERGNPHTSGFYNPAQWRQQLSRIFISSCSSGLTGRGFKEILGRELMTVRASPADITAARVPDWNQGNKGVCGWVCLSATKKKILES